MQPEIRTKRVRKQKTNRQDAQLLLRLLLENRFPRIWVPDAANRDLRQLLWYRHRLVQMRTRVMNQLNVVALNEGLRRKKAWWRPARSCGTGVDRIVSVGQAATPGLTRCARPTDAEDPGMITSFVIMRIGKRAFASLSQIATIRSLVCSREMPYWHF